MARHVIPAVVRRAVPAATRRFLSYVHNYVPKNAVIIEALPTADRGTNDSTGYIHGLVRSRYTHYKFGFLPVETEETGFTALRDDAVPNLIKYNEPTETVLYKRCVKSGKNILQLTKFA